MSWRSELTCTGGIAVHLFPKLLILLQQAAQLVGAGGLSEQLQLGLKLLYILSLPFSMFSLGETVIFALSLFPSLRRSLV
jgi:hypothetical protein